MFRGGAVSEVVTGEAVALDLRLAKLPSRLIAAVLDVAVQGAALLALLLLGGFVLRGADAGLGGALSIVLIVAVLLGYPIAMETLTRGRTLGKMVMGIRVVREDGGPIAFRQALVRGLFAGLVEKPGLLFGFTAPLGVLVMLISSRGKRIGDFAAGTVVLQERVPAARTTYAVAMPPPLVGWAATLDLARLDDGLALSVRQFLSRLPQLDARARTTIGDSLATAVAATVTPAAPLGTPAWAYLTAVLAERGRREQVRLANRTSGAFGPAAGGPPPSYGPTAPAAAGPGVEVPGGVRRRQPGDTVPGSAPAPAGPFAPPG